MKRDEGNAGSVDSCAGEQEETVQYPGEPHLERYKRICVHAKVSDLSHSTTDPDIGC